MSGPHGNTHDKGCADRADSTVVEGHHLTCNMATAMMWCRCVSPWCICHGEICVWNHLEFGTRARALVLDFIWNEGILDLEQIWNAACPSIWNFRTV